MVNSYQIYINKELMPITPDKITANFNGRNETLELISGQVINHIKEYDLPTWEMKLLIPRVDYPFRNKNFPMKSQDYYLDFFNKIAQKKVAVELIIIRTMPNATFDYGNESVNGDNIININDISESNGILVKQNVSLENYSIEDDASNGFDLWVNLELKQFINYSTVTKTYTTNSTTSTVIATTETTRPADTKEIPKNYTVKKGDCLYNICKAQLGDGNKYHEIAKLNNIANPDLIYPGQALRLR